MTTIAAQVANRVIGRLVAGMSTKAVLKHHSRRVRSAERKPLVYVAAMPKSAGTFICRTIADAHGLRYLHFSDRRGCCEFDIYHPHLLSQIQEGGIAHQHTPGTEGNVHYLNTYKIPCVVLTRNIYDALYSFYEHLEQYRNSWPMFEYPDGYFEMREDDKLHFLTATVAPWLLHFYVSWYRARKDRRIDALWMTYESFLQDNVAAINSIEALLNIPPEQRLKDVPAGGDRAALRMNKGVAGRGLSAMSDELRARIRAIMAFYPDVDFDPIAS
jgi:hypothetical protein